MPLSQTKTCVTVFKMSTIESIVFRKHYSKLQNGLQSPSLIAGELYSKNIIDQNVRDAGQMITSTVLAAITVLLNAVERAISKNPQCFHQFMDILDEDPTTQPLRMKLMNTYDELRQSHSNSSSSLPQSPSSTPPHTITSLPQRLRIKGPDEHFTTVKVVPDALGKNPEDADQWYTLPLSILDHSSDKPLSCAVALKGDKQAPGKGTMVCYLTLDVKNEVSQGSTDQPILPTPYVERSTCNEYTADGSAKFRMCFYTETSYSISVSVHCVQDKEGVECVGYNVDQYKGTRDIRAVRMVERNAFKCPPLLKFHGPLASEDYQKQMTKYRKLHYQGKHDQIRELVSTIASDDGNELDIRLFISAEFIRNSRDIAKGEELLKKCQTLECQNVVPLEAYIALTLSTLYSDKGDNKKSLELIRLSRSACCCAAPSYLTSQVFYVHARNLLRHHKGTVTPRVKKEILELLDRAINDSYFGIGWERYVIYLTNIKKALFCLNGKTDFDINPTPGYTPTDEDFALAEQHLKAIPVDELLENTWYTISYYIVWSDFYRLSGNTESAIKYAESAKEVLDARNLKAAPLYEKELGKHIRSRLEYLEAHPLHKKLEELS